MMENLDTCIRNDEFVGRISVVLSHIHIMLQLHASIGSEEMDNRRCNGRTS